VKKLKGEVTFSVKQQKSLECSLLEELEYALPARLKQACVGNASKDGTHLKEKALHIASHLGIARLLASNGWINRFSKIHKIVYRTLSAEGMSQSETVGDWKNYYCKRLKVMTSVIYIMLTRQVYFSIYNLVKPSLSKEILAMVVQNLNSRSLCSLHAMLMVAINYHLL
jgi:hypothetical protein